MEFKHVLGLDIGTNSLGWCLLKEYKDGKVEIIKTGVHIFPIGTIVDDKSNKEKTKNEQRRGYRGASRMRFRFKLRRANLIKALDCLGMLPDYSKYYNAKGLGQSYELYKLRSEAINPANKIPLNEIGRIFMLLNKYRGFKSNRKNPKENKETGVVKKGIEQLKGFMQKNNAATIGQYFFLMHEKAKEMYNQNKWHNYNEPIDERAYINDSEFVLFNSNGIRRHYGRPTSRDLYLDEFDKIWAAQKKHYPEILDGSKLEYDNILSLPYKKRIEALKEFKKTNYWHIREYCIYYQRPLKSQKKYVSTCQFERGVFNIEKYSIEEGGLFKDKQTRIWKKKAKKACPKSHPLFQEFRIWQKLHQISYSSIVEDVFVQKMKPEWLPIIAEYLMDNRELYLGKPRKDKIEGKQWIGNLLKQNNLISQEEGYSFFIDKIDEDVDNDDRNENKIIGNLTYSLIKESIGEEIYNQIKYGSFQMVSRKNVSTLDDLWHHLYIAKDGLFKEIEWLKCILSEETKWNFSEEQTTKLIEQALPPDYGSYSSKVLKSILPFMRKGINEYEALKLTGLGYINEDNTIGKKVQLKEKISQLAYQELRNPVVEKALSKNIKLVNAILEKYNDEINRATFEIRIESTRQLRKPRQQRENERRDNAEKDKRREEYANFLTKRKVELGFSKDIKKYDSIVSKYELWLQMNMNEEDEIFIQEFPAFSKITKDEDRLKHRLWQECGRICPYTGETISLSSCFSSDVEIEHIIPLSRSLDDSFNNKTLTWRHTNAEKGSMTPMEYMQQKGGDAIRTFKKIINSKYNRFSPEKKKMFFAEKIEANFSHNQLSNTSYIANYTRKKMQEVCSNVQFTNGAVTGQLRNYDWSLYDLLDIIRYEEKYGININEYFSQYYFIRKDFSNWYKNKFNTTDFNINWNKINENESVEAYIKETNNDLLYWNIEIEKFNNFKNSFGKKDRSDHRHHAIDAFLTACSSRRITQLLSTYNAQRENEHLTKRYKIEKVFSYDNLKSSISNIIVSHSEKQVLIKKRKNRIHTKEGIKTHYTYAPQGKLHQESFYAKRNGATIRRDNLFNDQRQDKGLFEQASDLDYSVKGTVKWTYIADPELYKITKQRLEKLNKKAFLKHEMENNPFYRVSPNTPERITSKRGKPLPIVKSVRKRFNTDRTLINLPAKDKEGNVIFKNRYAENESNSLIVLYENKVFDIKGNSKKSERDFEILSFYKEVSRKIPNNVSFKNGRLFLDEKDNIGLNKDCNWLKIGDVVVLFIDDNDKIDFDWDNNLLIKERIFVVKGLSSDNRIIKGVNYEYGYVSLLKTRIAKTTSYTTVKDIKESIESDSSKVSHVKLNAIKVRLNILGDVIAKGDECF